MLSYRARTVDIITAQCVVVSVGVMFHPRRETIVFQFDYFYRFHKNNNGHIFFGKLCLRKEILCFD